MASKAKYALSITMKYGEVLHLEGISLEEKNEYFALIKTDHYIIVEDRNRIRKVSGRDIASISYVQYDDVYEKTMHPIKKMLFSESIIGHGIYSLLSKVFILLLVAFVVAGMASEFVGGTLMTTALNKGDAMSLIITGINNGSKYFVVFFAIMLTLSVIDMLLGINSNYYINPDGADPVQRPKYLGLLYTISFAVIYKIIISILSSIV